MKHKILTWCVVGMLCMISAGGTLAQTDVKYDEIVVNFVDTATAEQIQNLAQKLGVQLVYNSIFSQPEQLMRFSVNPANADAVASLMQLLSGEKAIEYAEPNYIYEEFFVPNDPMYEKQWNMTMLNMKEAWETTQGKGAVVAVIDTGVAYENYKDSRGTYHRVPDLAQTKFVPGYDFIDDDEHANDDNGHGTHVAGTIAQSTNNKLGVAGIAPQAAVMPLKVLSRQGYGNIADIAEAIVFAADHGAHVINMSLGGGGESKTMREAIEYAHKKGVTVICAAGNAGRSGASYPAAYPYSIGVSSVGPTGSLAPYSNYGNGVDIAAPGGDTSAKKEDGVLQNTIGMMDPTTDRYEYFQGTSMASPHVAGVAALIISAGVKNPDQVEKILLATATKKGDQVKYGAGVVNAAAAVRMAMSGEEASESPASNDATQQSPFPLRKSMIYFLAGVGFALIYFKLLSRTDGFGKIFSFLFSLAMFLASSGLFFVEYLPLSFAPKSLLHALSAPIPNLDGILLGYSSNLLNPIFHSALLPVILIVVLLSTKSWKSFAIGFALGMASHLFIDTFFSLANVTWIPGPVWLLDKVWLLANGAVCFGLAYLAGTKE